MMHAELMRQAGPLPFVAGTVSAGNTYSIRICQNPSDLLRDAATAASPPSASTSFPGPRTLMSDTSSSRPSPLAAFLTPGLLCLVLATVAAGIYFREGIDALLVAWQLPEYSHGPLIPVLSALLFLRQLKEVPVNDGPVTDRGVGVGGADVRAAAGARSASSRGSTTSWPTAYRLGRRRCC